MPGQALSEITDHRDLDPPAQECDSHQAKPDRERNKEKNRFEKAADQADDRD